MKNLLRASGLIALLGLMALAIPGRATQPLGSCQTTCYKGLSHTSVYWGATLSQCCSGGTNPCPAGYFPAGSSYAPPAGNFMGCPY
jgi:hypothetical protein